MKESFSWITVDFITTFTGAVFVTNIMTHFIKDYLPDSLDKKIVPLIIAILVMGANLFVFDKVTLQNAYLSIVNAFLVAAAAMGNYEILTRKTRKALRKEEETKNNDIETSQRNYHEDKK